MKEILTKFLGVLGLGIYYPLALALRIPVFFFLTLVIVIWLLIWNPITGKDNIPKWVNQLYDWYRGE